MSAPCRCCGAAAGGPTVEGRGLTEYSAGPDLALCADCESLDLDRPGSAVRAALRLLGKPERDEALAAEAFIAAELDVAALMFESTGRSRPQRAWAHVTREHRALLRRAYVRVLDLRVHAAARYDRPVPPTAPPHGPRGCLACGVGASPAWRAVRTRALTRGSAYVDGHLCGTCAAVYDAVGALGQPFVERAAAEAQGRAWGETVRYPGLTAWAATGRPPGRPWEWVELLDPKPDLDPMTVLQMQVNDLGAEIEALAARLAR